jgi:hypothetical protein
MTFIKSQAALTEDYSVVYIIVQLPCEENNFQAKYYSSSGNWNSEGKFLPWNKIKKVIQQELVSAGYTDGKLPEHWNIFEYSCLKNKTIKLETFYKKHFSGPLISGTL